MMQRRQAELVLLVARRRPWLQTVANGEIDASERRSSERGGWARVSAETDGEQAGRAGVAMSCADAAPSRLQEKAAKTMPLDDGTNAEGEDPSPPLGWTSTDRAETP